MATDLIPFGNLLEAGYDEIAGGSPCAMNVIVDARATMRRRPGIATYSEAYTGVVTSAGLSGVYATNAGRIFAVSTPLDSAYVTNGYKESLVYLVSDTASALLSVDAGRKLYGPGRPVFAETESLLCIAQGNEIKRVTLTDPSLPIGILGLPVDTTITLSGLPENHYVSGQAFVSIATWPLSLDSTSGMTQLPPFSSHVIVNSSRILGNDSLIDKTKIRYSDVAQGVVDFTGHDTWLPGPNAAGFFTAEANPDPVVALFENTNEVFAFGSRVLQVFGPDPGFVFATSAAIELGCAAPYSVVKRNQGFWWLDAKRRFVFSDGRAFDESIGNPIKPVIDSFSTVSDCYGYSVTEGTIDCMVWTFPTAGRSFCYQPGVGWGEWSGWSEATDNWTTLPITAHHHNVNDAVNIVGTADGRIGKLTRTASTDLGVRIKAYVETGFLDRGTSAKKRTREVRLTLRRGQSSSSTAPLGYLSYRDSLGSWSSPLAVSLGAGGDVGTVVRFRNVGGPYRTRQWRFEFDGSDELVLVKVEEDFDVIGQPQE